MNDVGPPYVGRSLLRREDRRLLTGQGQFIADLVLPKMLHAVLVRSPVAHDRIRSVDLSRAAAMPGVMLALNGADLLQLREKVVRGRQDEAARSFGNGKHDVIVDRAVRGIGDWVARIGAPAVSELRPWARAGVD